MPTVTIFGGSGFVGRSLVQKFAENGYQVRVAVRNPIAAQFLKPLGDIGQIIPIQASIRSSNEIRKAIQGADVVINLVGILYEQGTQTFESIHVEGAKLVAKLSSKEGVPILLHMSALGANKGSRSNYAASKARGEEAVHKYFPKATIFRPSIIFGPKDAFFNRFAEMALLSPFLPVIGGGETKMQPLFVSDVSESFFNATNNNFAQGKTFELGGPTIYSFRELMEYLLITTQRRRILLPIPYFMAKGLARIAQFIPGVPLTPDQVELLKIDNVVSTKFFKIDDLKVRPVALETIVPTYLQRYKRLK